MHSLTCYGFSIQGILSIMRSLGTNYQLKVMLKPMYHLLGVEDVFCREELVETADLVVELWTWS